jgi:hypothetical protein
MAFDPGGGGGQGGGGWNPGGNPPPGGGGWGQPPQPGAPQQPQQGAWGQPPQQGAPQPGAPQQPQQGAWGQPQPQAAPQQPAWGAPPGAPQAQPQAAWGQQAGQAFGQAAGQLGQATNAALGGPAPTNPWFPAAVVSWLFPGLGLLLLKDKNRNKLAGAIFGGYVALYIVLAVLWSVFANVLEIGALAVIISLLQWLVHLVARFGTMIFTHDETVKAYPHLGQPIFFKNPVNLPPALQ